MPIFRARTAVALAMGLLACSSALAQEEQNASFMPTSAAQVEKAAPKEIKAVDLGVPVTAATLPAVDPDTSGLLSTAEGGLGEAMWKNTSREMVDRLLTELKLPTASPTLNGLARRLLLSTAVLPEGKATGRSLTSLRVEKLLALGDVAEAWKLAERAPAKLVDAPAWRAILEVGLINPDSKTLCDKVPALMVGQNGAEAQRALIVCQLRAKDTAAAQLGLDLMREEKVRDDVFLSLASRNILGESKQLPRQLTPLKPLNLALLRQIGLPLPPELFARPEAALIPELIQAKAQNDEARLALAERAAARNTINATQLAEVYRGVSFTLEALGNAKSSSETGARLHALLFQASGLEQDGSKQKELIAKWMSSVEPSALLGSMGQILADIVAMVPVTTDNNPFSATATRILALAGRPNKAMAWLKIARGPASKLSTVAAEMQNTWPLLVLSGLVADADYAKELQGWLEGAPRESDKENVPARQQKAGGILLLFSAAGYAVPESIFAQVVDTGPEAKKATVPSPLLLQRMRDAGSMSRRGEAALLAALLAGGGEETPLFVMADAARTLRDVGLTAEAQALAREAALLLLSPSAP